MYYLRTRPAAQAINFTLDHSLVAQAKQEKEQQLQQQQEIQVIEKNTVARPVP
jgi:ribonucleoside-diphosphate reductase subunit M1